VHENLVCTEISCIQVVNQLTLHSREKKLKFLTKAIRINLNYARKQ